MFVILHILKFHSIDKYVQSIQEHNFITVKYLKIDKLKIKNMED